MPLIPALAPLLNSIDLPQVLIHAWHNTSPWLVKLLSDPAGVVSRIGDTLVWSGSTGEKVIGGLTTLGDTQQRIESAIEGIQTAQLASQGVLGLVQSVSIATLGVTSLSGVFMVYRLNAINKRIDGLHKAIKDVEGKIDAGHKAHIMSSVQTLRDYDENPNEPDAKEKLQYSLREARRAANIYGTLSADEISGTIRLPVLNCRSRLYVLSLLTELRCMMSDDDSTQALKRLDDEMDRLKRIAATCFSQTFKSDPERYLTASFKKHGVGLNLLAGVYKQARTLKLIEKPQVDDADSMFELVRDRLLKKRRSVVGQIGEDVKGLMSVEKDIQNIRYVLACLEDTGRLVGLQKLIKDIQDRNGSVSELVVKLRELEQAMRTQPSNEGASVFAYTIDAQ